MADSVTKPITILVIEDDPMIRECYSRILESPTRMLVFSLDLNEIKRRIPEVDLILSDYEMGLDFNAIRDFAAQLNKPLLAATSIPNVHENQITKPFGTAALLTWIAHLTKEKRCA